MRQAYYVAAPLGVILLLISAARLPGQAETRPAEPAPASPLPEAAPKAGLKEATEATSTDLPIGQTLAGHSYGAVLSVAFSPNGELLASGGEDGTIRLWNAKGGPTGRSTGQHTERLSGRGKAVSSVVFSPDGTCLAGAIADKTVKLWRIAKMGGNLGITTMKSRHTLGPHESRVVSVAFSPDGKTLAGGGGQPGGPGEVRLWDVQTGTLRRTLAAHDQRVNSVAFSPDGKTLASASEDGTAKLWDAQTAELKATLRGDRPRPGVLSVAFSPDGKTLALGDRQGRAELWSLETGRPRQTLTGHAERIQSVAFSRRGDLLASAGYDGGVKVWDARAGQLKREHRSQNRVFSVAFSPDGKTLATGVAGRTVYLLDLTPPPAETPGRRIRLLARGVSLGTVQDVRGLATAMSYVVTSRDNDHVAYVRKQDDKEVVVVDGVPGKPYDTIESPTPLFSPDGEHVAYVAERNGRQLVVVDGHEGREYDSIGSYPHFASNPLLADRVLRFSPDGRRVAYVAKRGTFVTGKKRPTGTALVVRPDGYLLSCAHVVNLKNVAKIEVTLGGATHHAKVWRVDERRDLAVLKIEANDLPALPMADSAAAELGEDVAVFGFPFGAEFGEGIRMTRGTLSGTATKQSRKFFQVDAAVDPGNSGGPLVNRWGEVIGVVNTRPADRAGSNIGFAVPINDAVPLLPGKNAEPRAGRAEAKLDGVALAKRVSPATALVKVTPKVRNPAGGKCMVVVDRQEGKEYDRIDKLVFSPDGKRVAYVGVRGGKQVVVVDGVEGKEYMPHEMTLPVFSADGQRVAYVATTYDPKPQGRKGIVVVDGKELDGTGFPGEGGVAPVFSPDGKHVAYKLIRNEQQQVIIDGEEGAAYQRVDRPIFSPDGNRVAYVARRSGKALVVVDGKEGQQFDGIAMDRPFLGNHLRFSPDGRRVAYVAVKQNAFLRTRSHVVVVDGVEGKPYNRVDHFLFSPDGRHVAYVGQDPGKEVVVVDGKEREQYERIVPRSLVFSPNSQRVAYVAWHPHGAGPVMFVVVVDGVEGREYRRIGNLESHPLVPKGTPLFSPDSRHVAYLASRQRESLLVVDTAEMDAYRFCDGGVVSDGPSRLHAIAYRRAANRGGRGQEYFRVQVEIVEE